MHKRAQCCYQGLVRESRNLPEEYELIGLDNGASTTQSRQNIDKPMNVCFGLYGNRYHVPWVMLLACDNHGSPNDFKEEHQT